jgi:N-acyl homoserine lactone hydrolase
MSPSYRIKPLPLLTVTLDMGIFTYRLNYGQKVEVPFFSWLIEGPKERILVDTGISAADLRSFRGFECKEIQSFEEALASNGLTPADIDMVIQTHLHYDHSFNTGKCVNARVVVQESELKFALAPHPMMWELYDRQSLSKLRYCLVEGDKDIIPGIRVIHVPGHSPGAQAVAVSTDKGLAVISGFCSTFDTFNVEPGSPHLVHTPGTHTDPMAAYDSAVKIKGLADILVPQHALEFLGKQYV